MGTQVFRGGKLSYLGQKLPLLPAPPPYRWNPGNLCWGCDVSPKKLFPSYSLRGSYLSHDIGIGVECNLLGSVMLRSSGGQDVCCCWRITMRETCCLKAILPLPCPANARIMRMWRTEHIVTVYSIWNLTAERKLIML